MSSSNSLYSTHSTRSGPSRGAYTTITHIVIPLNLCYIRCLPKVRIIYFAIVHLRSTRTIVTQRTRYLGARYYFKQRTPHQHQHLVGYTNIRCGKTSTFVHFHYMFYHYYHISLKTHQFSLPCQYFPLHVSSCLSSPFRHPWCTSCNDDCAPSGSNSSAKNSTWTYSAGNFRCRKTTPRPSVCCRASGTRPRRASRG